MKFLTLLTLFTLLTLSAVQADNVSYTIVVSQPATESYCMVSDRSEVISVKRDTDITSDNKVVEAGYHLQVTPHLDDPNHPYLKLYIKSIIADPSSKDPKTPGFTTRAQSVQVSLVKDDGSAPKLPGALPGVPLKGTASAFDGDHPVSFQIFVTLPQ